MNDHTPAPWTIKLVHSDQFEIHADNRRLALAYGDFANARLIAAAPDLLRALKTALPCVIEAKVDAESVGDPKDIELWTMLLDRCETALLKAGSA